ncbi:hypothetical protein N9M66_02650 [Litoreibacter sp.]|nr:hypothetical protein [Litoreibacter sp.]
MMDYAFSKLGSLMLLVLMCVFWTFGALTLGLTIRAVLKGKDYIAASNYGWGKSVVDRVFQSSLISKYLFKLTPFAIMITSGWAGFSLISDLAWPLETIGFVSNNDGEWRSYQTILASSIGAPIGLLFGCWLVTLCSSKISKEFETEILYPDEQLAKIVGVKM